MNVQIQVLNVEITTKQGKKPYQNANIAFKDLTAGKVNSKNITAYSKVFNTVAEAKAGEFYDVVSEKNGEYWEWTSMVRNLNGATASVSPEPSANISSSSRTVAAPRSNYETPEERAKKQVYIVRQSSITSAIAVLTAGAKAPPKVEEVLDLARRFVDFVFDADNPETGVDLFELPNDIEVE